MLSGYSAPSPLTRSPSGEGHVLLLLSGEGQGYISWVISASRSGGYSVLRVINQVFTALLVGIVAKSCNDCGL